MKMDKIGFIILLLIIANNTFGQFPIIKSVCIKYVDFTIVTDAHVDCNSFEESFNFKSIELTDTFTINELTNYAKKIKIDLFNNHCPDTRAKIILDNKDVICISNFGICINSKVVLYNEDFIVYIIELIKKLDPNFYFKIES